MARRTTLQTSESASVHGSCCEAIVLWRAPRLNWALGAPGNAAGPPPTLAASHPLNTLPPPTGTKRWSGSDSEQWRCYIGIRIVKANGRIAPNLIFWQTSWSSPMTGCACWHCAASTNRGVLHGPDCPWSPRCAPNAGGQRWWLPCRSKGLATSLRSRRRRPLGRTRQPGRSSQRPWSPEGEPRRGS